MERKRERGREKSREANTSIYDAYMYSEINHERSVYEIECPVEDTNRLT